MYFTGEFGFKWVDGTKPLITKLPTTLKIGDWCEQGFSCYTGAMTYSIDVEINPEPGKRTVLEIPEWKGALVKVYVNGKKAGNIAWRPYEIDITDYIAKGKNNVRIEVVGTRRNLLGPLHHGEKYPNWTGPGEFKREDKWIGEYVSFPYGLMSGVSLSTRA